MKPATCNRWFICLPKYKFSKTRNAAQISTQAPLIKTQKVHVHASQLGGSAIELTRAHSRCESIASLDAPKLFDELSHCDVVSATSRLCRLAKQNHHEEAVCYFSRMLELDIKPNEFTFGTVIHSSIVLNDLLLGKQLHACATKIGLSSNVFVSSTILDLYVKLSRIEEAQKAFKETDKPNVVSYTTLISGYLKEERFDEAVMLFQKIPEKNVVSWNAMISGCSQTGNNEEAVNLFVRMLREGLLPSESSFPCAIVAAANIAALGMGRSFHACALKFLGSKLGVFVGNSLVSFYAKCGSMGESRLAFDKLPRKSVVSWNAVICGYAQNGKGKEAIDVYQRMKSSGVRPNSVTLLGLLLACNHVGLVEEGYSYFNQARLQEPSMLQAEHYACVVDLMSRAGRFQEAIKFIADLPFDPGIGFWKAILGGCRIHSNMELGEFAASKILALDPGDVSSFLMLSNAHSAAGRWQCVSRIRHEMNEKGLNRVPGCSWIEIKSKVHVFVTGEYWGHAQGDEIHDVLTLTITEIQDIDLVM
ncbi:pentatricopeptide repeat-containing protein At5g42450, mitochondrial-like [Coffea arabica]|uniref:Pentatricopeptide repeat-containing protein At5g42450, mitochondrial-like n=1 Tax=Coffea arabica TaxID=13443 RepID=A0A6P6SX92_COFAR